MKHMGGKAFDLGLEEWVGDSRRRKVEAPGRTDLSGMGNSLGRTGSRRPEAVVGDGYRWCSERRKGLPEAKLRGPLTSRLFLLFLCPLPDLSPGTLGDIR